MLKSPSQLPIEIKISTVVAISTILHSADPLAIDAALKQMTGGVSDFFEDEFAVIDVSAIAAGSRPYRLGQLVDLLKKYRLNAVAVRGATPGHGRSDPRPRPVARRRQQRRQAARRSRRRRRPQPARRAAPRHPRPQPLRRPPPIVAPAP